MRSNKIISLVPSHTEVLFYLGLGSRVVGVTENCDFPEETINIEKVGTFGQPQISAIISKKPDLVLADNLLHKKVVGELKKLGIKVLAAAPNSLDDVFDVMYELGLICDIETEASLKISLLKARISKLAQRSSRIKPKVLRPGLAKQKGFFSFGTA